MHRFYSPLALCLLVLYGCEAPPDAVSAEHTVTVSTTEESPQQTPPRRQSAGEPAATVIDARPAAIINGRTVPWGELRPLLNEAAGAEILQEVALDRMLREIIERRGIRIGENEIVAERRLMLDMLDPDDANRAVRLLRELRTRTGLGDQRFDALLRRNAVLRALVRDRVEITEPMVRQIFDAVYGPRRQARLLTLPSLSETKHAIERIESGEAFGDVAVELSTDASAARGGLLEPISRSDASYPDSFRRVLWELEPGELSSPLLLDEQYAVMQLVREIEGDDVEFEDVRPAMERRARLAQERLRMDQLARSLLSDVSITIFDRALKQSWDMNRGREE